MAAAIVGEVAGLLGSSGLAGQIGRAALTGIGAVAVTDLIKAVEADLGVGGTAAATARRVPQYAIVDLHANKTIRFLSAHKVYVLLTSKRRRRGSNRPSITRLPRGSIVEVK